MSNHVLITGGLGFIGHNLARYYLDEGYYVTVVDNLKNHHDEASLTKYRIEYLDSKKLNFIQVNCNMNYAIVDKLRSNLTPKTIIHLAEVGGTMIHEQDAYYVTSSLSANAYSVATLSKELSCKLIYVSSSLTYGDLESGPHKESTTCSPNRLFGLLKLNCEMIMKLINPNSIIVRADTVYGPGDNKRGFIPQCIHSILNDDEVLVKRYNENDPIHISDLIRGIKSADDHGLSGEIYNLSYGESRTDNEIALLIKNIANSKSIINYEFDRMLGLSRKGLLDITKARDQLGFKPKMDIIDGLRSYVDWIKKYNHL